MVPKMRCSAFPYYLGPQSTLVRWPMPDWKGGISEPFCKYAHGRTPDGQPARCLTQGWIWGDRKGNGRYGAEEAYRQRMTKPIGEA